MHRRLLTGLFMICASAGVAAQAPPSSSQPPATSQSAPTLQRAPAPDQAVSYTGCLQRGLAATSPAPNAVSTSGTGGFVLANATRSTPTAGSATDQRDPVGTSGGAPTAGVSYRLEGDETKLAPHVGHKVEISGSVNEHVVTSPNTDTTSGNTGRTSGNAPSLKVESVKMVASTCTAR
jgi:hypothetical protein